MNTPKPPDKPFSKAYLAHRDRAIARWMALYGPNPDPEVVARHQRRWLTPEQMAEQEARRAKEEAESGTGAGGFRVKLRQWITPAPEAAKASKLEFGSRASTPARPAPATRLAMPTPITAVLAAKQPGPAKQPSGRGAVLAFVPPKPTQAESEAETPPRAASKVVVLTQARATAARRRAIAAKLETGDAQ